jgi:glycosyltransferase involved in cell wall biosynthesis
MIGEYYSKKFNLNIGDLVNYKNKLYLLLDLYIKNDRIVFVKLESIENNSKIEIPALYIDNKHDRRH